MRKVVQKSLLALAVSTGAGALHAAQLEEIVVTAQQRAESLQDVPVSVAAVTAKKCPTPVLSTFRVYLS
jgi:iron complex outermembrane receptor protein